MVIKRPKDIDEALEIVHQLSKAFKFEAIIISKQDFDDHMGTENWTKKDYDKAIYNATDRLCEDVGFVLDETICHINQDKSRKPIDNN
jgi:hypothetical protein